MSDDEVIHNLNGWQIFMFRANLVVLPILLTSIIALSAWVVQSQSRVASQLAVIEDRISKVAFQDSVRVQMLELRQRILSEVSAKHPPFSLLEDVHENKVDIKELHKRIIELEKLR